MKISCIIPTCDRPDFLPETLQSVFRQTVRPHEIIVVNNGGGPLSLPDDYSSRVRVFTIPPYAGVAQARNFGAAVAAGDVLAFLDDDDSWSQEYLHHASQAIAAGAACVISRLDRLVDGNGQSYKNAQGKISTEHIFVHNPGITGSNTVITKDAFFAVHGYNPKLPPSEDKSLVLELLFRGLSVVALPDNQAIIRQHPHGRLSDPAKLAEGVSQFVRTYGNRMTGKQRRQNLLKVYAQRRQAGQRGAFFPFVVYYLAARIERAIALGTPRRERDRSTLQLLPNRMRKAMRFAIRPSKIFLFRLLDRQLRDVRGEIGIDAASAHFKNRWMFRTQRYYGIDINLEELRRGIEKYASDATTFGIHADILHLAGLPDQCAAAVISTNTLHQLSGTNRSQAVEQLARLTAPNGMLLCEMPIDGALAPIVQQVQSIFTSVTVVYYKNPISRWYERAFERNGELGTHPIAGTRPLRLFAWALSLTESLSCHWSAGNRHAILICRTPRLHRPQPFHLANVAEIYPKIYSLIH